MVLSPRGILAIGLSLAGIAGFVITSRIQAQQPQKADGTVRAASNGNGTAATGPAAPIPPVVGTVDLDIVMRNYDKVKDQMKELTAAVNVRRGELMKLETEYRQEGEMLQKFTPGSGDYKKLEDRMTVLKAQVEAGQEQAQREFTLRQAESLATIYKEIQGVTVRVANWRKMNYVLKVSTKPPAGTDPNSVMAAVAEPVIYADPRNDITNDVVHYLNQFYRATKNPAGTPKSRCDTTGAARRGPARTVVISPLSTNAWRSKSPPAGPSTVWRPGPVGRGEFPAVPSRRSRGWVGDRGPCGAVLPIVRPRPGTAHG